jgi:hypothetical protein
MLTVQNGGNAGAPGSAITYRTVIGAGSPLNSR